MRVRGGKVGVFVAAMLGVLCAAGPSLAGDDDDDVMATGPTGIELGFRSGYALGLGDDLEGVDGQVPLWFDFNYRLRPFIAVGAWFQHGFVSSDGCKEGCSASNFRIGAQVQGHFLPEGPFDPWIGAGLGYEWLTTSTDRGSSALRGFQLVNVSVGVDYKLRESFGVGPFVDVSVARYSSISVNDASADIPEPTIHSWLTFGLRAIFDLHVGAAKTKARRE